MLTLVQSRATYRNSFVSIPPSTAMQRSVIFDYLVQKQLPSLDLMEKPLQSKDHQKASLIARNVSQVESHLWL